MSGSDLAWIGWALVSATGCLFGVGMAATRHRRIACGVLALSLAVIAVGLALPRVLPLSSVESAQESPLALPEGIPVTIASASTATSPTLSTAERPPIAPPVDLAPPPLPEPVPSSARESPQATPAAASLTVREKVGPVLLGATAPSALTLLLLLLHPASQTLQRRRQDRYQWRAIQELEHILDSQMGEQAIGALELEYPEHYACLCQARDRAKRLHSLHIPRYRRRDLALLELAYPGPSSPGRTLLQPCDKDDFEPIGEPTNRKGACQRPPRKKRVAATRDPTAFSKAR